MSNSKKRVLAIACGVMIATLALPAASSASLCGWLFGGCSACKAPTCAAPVAVAPACATCAPRACGYMPTVVYRALYQPAAPCAACAAPCSTCAAYQPAGCSTCAPVYATTTYRPAFGWISEPRVVAYTTYRPVVPAVACGSCNACSSCNTCAGYSPCTSCGGGCAAASYGEPVSSCPTCQSAAPAAPVVVAPVAPTMVAPSSAATVVPGPYPGPSQAPAMQNTPTPDTGSQRTFQDNKPSSSTEQLKPIPEQPGVALTRCRTRYCQTRATVRQATPATRPRECN